MPAVLVTVALRATVWLAALNGTDAEAAATAVAAALIVKEWLLSVKARKLAVPL